jgi:hypothetical protein
MLRIENASLSNSRSLSAPIKHFAYDSETGFYLCKISEEGRVRYSLFDSTHPRTPAATFSAPGDEYAIRKANAILFGWDLVSQQ